MTRNTKKLIYFVGLSLIAGLFIGWLIFGGSGRTESQLHEHTETSDSETWTCSMHPQIRSQEPGDCPICGMDLIPLAKSENDVNPLAVSMSQTAMLLAGVSTAQVGMIKPVKSISLSGKIQTDERRIFSQSTHIPGRIERLSVSFTGEYISKGQVIAMIYSPELVTAQQELLVSHSMQKAQPQLYQAARNKLRNWKLTDLEIDQIIESGKTKEQFPIRADISGYITKKMVNLGDYVSQGKAIYEIADLSKVWVLFDVYESDLPWVQKGDEVAYHIASLPGKEFTGRITYIDPIIHPRTRVAKARLEVSNINQSLKPEMFVSGMLEASIPKTNESLVIPKSAVMWTGIRSIVYVKETTSNAVSFLMREITLGASLGDNYIVEDGLEIGEEIAVNGTFSIDAAAQLAGKPSMMNPEGGQAMTAHDHGGTNTSSASSQSHTQDPISISSNARNALKPLFDNYNTLKDALTLDDFTAAVKAANAMSNSVTDVNMSLFKGESHELWMTYSADLGKSLKHVPHMKGIGELRDAFYGISNTMIAMASALGPMDDELYVQFCPMARDNNGAEWLSRDPDIENPYFGASMFTCGEVLREIK